jgi:hypothetical protein
VRFLDELKVFEFKVTPFPMNQYATAVAKSGAAAMDDDRVQLERLELWARASAAEQALAGMTDPDVAAHVVRVLAEAKAQTDLAQLQRWADSQPPPKREDRTRSHAPAGSGPTKARTPSARRWDGWHATAAVSAGRVRWAGRVSTPVELTYPHGTVRLEERGERDLSDRQFRPG